MGGSGLRTMLAEAFASYRSRGLTTPKWRSNRVVRHVAEQPSATVATVQPHCQPDAKLMGVRRGMATTNASERKLTDRLAQPHGRFIMPKGRYLLQASGLTSTCRASNSRFRPARSSRSWTSGAVTVQGRRSWWRCSFSTWRVSSITLLPREREASSATRGLSARDQQAMQQSADG